MLNTKRIKKATPVSPKLKFSIEINGEIHSKYGRTFQDQKKNELLKELGIKVARISTIDLEEDYESIVVHLEDLFKKRADELCD